MECKRCLANSTISSLKLDSNGICQFCKIHDEMDKEYPLNKYSEKNIFKIAETIKQKGKNLNYDCLVGVSGGRDSTFLLYYVRWELVDYGMEQHGISFYGAAFIHFI